jgi:pyrroline-5-carboxylate reductase
MSSVLIIGAGNMGSALARGLGLSETPSPARFKVRIHDVHQDRLAEIAKPMNAQICGDLQKDALIDDAIVLCVKPQDLAAVATQLRGRIKKERTTLISILAGITLEDLTVAFATDGAVVRAMPNIAAMVGQAATALCHNGKLTQSQIDLSAAIFYAIGTADWTKESLLDAVTGLSGSGPAYVYMVIEALTDGGVKMGIPRALSLRLATQTVLGAASLVKETNLHPAVLRDQVTTPGGTTIHAIHELEARGLRAMLISAVETATQKSAVLRLKK